MILAETTGKYIAKRTEDNYAVLSPAKEILYTEEEVKHIATRFGRKCVINQLNSCNDRIMHFEKWFASVFHRQVKIININ